MKKYLKIFGVLICGGALFANVLISANKSAKDVALFDLSLAAEACSEAPMGWSAGGKCLPLSNMCIHAVGESDCHPGF